MMDPPWTKLLHFTLEIFFNTPTPYGWGVKVGDQAILVWPGRCFKDIFGRGGLPNQCNESMNELITKLFVGQLGKTIFFLQKLPPFKKRIFLYQEK